MSEFKMMDACDEKAKTMPHFTMLAKDKLALICVDKWIQLAKSFDVPQAKLDEAEAVRNAMLKWQVDNAELCKIPD